MGFFSGLASEGYDRQYSDRELIARMAKYFRPYSRQLLAVIILLLLLAGSGAASPVIVSRGVDEIEGQLNMNSLALICGAIFFIGVFNWATNWLRRRITVRMIGNIILDLRTQAFQATADHDLSFYDEFSSGKIVSRITSDTQDFAQTVVLVTDLVSQFVQAFILGTLLVSTQVRLSIYLFAYLPVLFLSTLGFRRLARNVTRAGMRAMANVNSTIKETVSGIAIAKNFRQEAGVFTEFDQANRQSYRVNVRRGLVLSLVFPMLNALSGVATAIMVSVGGLSAAEGLVSVGAWFLFLQSLDRFFFPVQNLSAFWTQVQSGLSASERVFGLIDAEAQVLQVDSRTPPLLKGDILFEDVWFSYTGVSPDVFKEAVLCDFNLYIRPGETIALVGHTGAGKSSIARLIARFYEFQRGKIWIDGHDIRSFDLHLYRSQLGIVSQTPFLFSGTVAENICYACSTSATYADLTNLGRQIGDGEWLESLPQGLDTQVGERGGRLSMGQRQLVALMRVLVHRPVVFILDEATASVDPFTEWQIQQALNLILKDTTSILIAHRLSTVKAADRIIVLENGKIIEEGNHSGLLGQGGHYATLYNTYFRHQSLDYRPTGLDEFLKLKLATQAGD